MYTDASDYFWAGAVTQITVSDAEFPCADQYHETVAFSSGHLSESFMGWSIIQKEGFAIMATIERMHWLLAPNRGFDL